MTRTTLINFDPGSTSDSESITNAFRFSSQINSLHFCGATLLHLFLLSLVLFYCNFEFVLLKKGMSNCISTTLAKSICCPFVIHSLCFMFRCNDGVNDCSVTGTKVKACKIAFVVDFQSRQALPPLAPTAHHMILLVKRCVGEEIRPGNDPHHLWPNKRQRLRLQCQNLKRKDGTIVVYC